MVACGGNDEAIQSFDNGLGLQGYALSGNLSDTKYLIGSLSG